MFCDIRNTDIAVQGVHDDELRHGSFATHAPFITSSAAVVVPRGKKSRREKKTNATTTTLEEEFLM